MSRIVVITPGRGLSFPIDNNSLCFYALARRWRPSDLDGLLPTELIGDVYYSVLMETLTVWMQP